MFVLSMRPANTKTRTRRESGVRKCGGKGGRGRSEVGRNGAREENKGMKGAGGII